MGQPSTVDVINKHETGIIVDPSSANSIIVDVVYTITVLNNPANSKKVLERPIGGNKKCSNQVRKESQQRSVAQW